jgi:rare lipoprotein A
MPLRQTIGISLALVMASTGAFAKAPEKNAAYHAATPPGAEPARSSSRSGKARSPHRGAHFHWPARVSFHHGGRPRHRHAAFDGAEAAASPSDAVWGPTHTTGYQQIGQAAWYNLIGGRTSSGERLDTVTPTAAHRSLPLGSCARVTSLDTGRSVVVKINDRGPYSRRFIIDLSPRAAEMLGMIHNGTAAVMVEPVAPGAAPAANATATAAVYRQQAANTGR